MGGLIGALSASGMSAGEIMDVARGFRFPRRFVPGGMLRWDSLFASATPALSVPFDRLVVPLAVTAVDLEAGTQVVLHTGDVLAGVRATCSVPGVLPPVEIGGRWLVDGGLVNVLPVDVAWMTDPEIVVAVKVGAPRERPLPQLNWRLTNVLTRLGEALPNPATAKVTLEVLARAAEIMLDRQAALASAMTDPEVLIEPQLGDLGLRDFHRLDDAVAAGRRATEIVLPDLIRLVESPRAVPATGERVLSLRFDPVCGMVISPSRARASEMHRGTVYYFCSANCRDSFERAADQYLDRPLLSFSAGDQ